MLSTTAKEMMHLQNRFTHLPRQLHVLIYARLASTSASSSSSFASGSSIPDPLLNGDNRNTNGSTSKQENPFPYPTHLRPTPHQIFHLAPGATQADIKARYYDLVRAHHPDSQLSRVLPQSEAHARFQSISAAYEALQKGQHWDEGDPFAEELERRRRAYYRTHRGMGGGTGHNRRAEYERPWTDAGAGGGFGGRGEGGGRRGHQGEKPSKEQIWRERLILGVGVTALMLGLYPSAFLGPVHLDKTHREAVSNLTQARNDAKELGELRRERVRERVKEIRCADGEGERTRGKGRGRGRHRETRCADGEEEWTEEKEECERRERRRGRGRQCASGDAGVKSTLAPPPPPSSSVAVASSLPSVDVTSNTSKSETSTTGNQADTTRKQTGASESETSTQTPTSAAHEDTEVEAGKK